MKYRAFIEDHFVIDDKDTGKLVPFRFNKVQNKYYDLLCAEFDIETKGISTPIREINVKARKEGFTSLVLALFAADDILQDNPTESEVISYKDQATDQFRKRYRNFVLAYFAKKHGHSWDEMSDMNLLDKYAKEAFKEDADGNYVLRENNAHFFCGTASARTGSRGGTVHKLLFSEAAFYPYGQAEEIIEGTSNQMSKSSGWCFIESTGNGRGNKFEIMYTAGKRGQIRYRSRFFGRQELYSPEEIEVIKSDFTDETTFKQEYPSTDDEAFQSSSSGFTNHEALEFLINHPLAKKQIAFWVELEGTNYISQCEIIKDLIGSYERSNPREAIYVGIDVAKTIDSTIVTVAVEKGMVTGGVRAIAIDSTGAGDFMPDWFTLNTRWYLIPVKFTAPSKDILYKQLDQVIQNQITALPELDTKEGKRFMLQMEALIQERRGNLLSVHHPESGENHRNSRCNKDTCPYHDDYPDSWALAEHAYVEINGIQAIQKKPEAPRKLSDNMTAFLNDSGTRNKSSISFE